MTTETTTPAGGGAVSNPPVAPTVEQATNAPPLATEPAVEGQQQQPAEEGQDKEQTRERPKKTMRDRFREVYGQNRERGRRIAQLEQRVRELERPITPRNIDYLDSDQRAVFQARQAYRDERREELSSDLQDEIRHERAATQEELESRINERNDDFRERLEDHESRDPGVFERFSRLVIHEPMAEYIGTSELGPELASYLTRREPQNREDLRQLQRLTNPRFATRASVREADQLLARIEARIDKATPPRRTTTAPNPGTTLNGSNTPPAEVSMQELAAKGEDASEYIKRRRAQWAKGEK